MPQPGPEAIQDGQERDRPPLQGVLDDVGNAFGKQDHLRARDAVGPLAPLLNRAQEGRDAKNRNGRPEPELGSRPIVQPRGLANGQPAKGSHHLLVPQVQQPGEGGQGSKLLEPGALSRSGRVGRKPQGVPSGRGMVKLDQGAAHQGSYLSVSTGKERRAAGAGGAHPLKDAPAPLGQLGICPRMPPVPALLPRGGGRNRSLGGGAFGREPQLLAAANSPQHGGPLAAIATLGLALGGSQSFGRAPRQAPGPLRPQSERSLQLPRPPGGGGQGARTRITVARPRGGVGPPPPGHGANGLAGGTIGSNAASQEPRNAGGDGGPSLAQVACRQRSAPAGGPISFQLAQGRRLVPPFQRNTR